MARSTPTLRRTTSLLTAFMVLNSAVRRRVWFSLSVVNAARSRVRKHTPLFDGIQSHSTWALRNQKVRFGETKGVDANSPARKLVHAPRCTPVTNQRTLWEILRKRLMLSSHRAAAPDDSCRSHEHLCWKQSQVFLRKAACRWDALAVASSFTIRTHA